MPSFQFSLNKRLRTLGLQGDVAWAMIHAGALQLQDDAQHVVRLLPTEISRARIGYVDAKRRAYHLRVWRDAGDKPIELIPTNATRSGYRDTAYEFAALMHQTHRLDRVETGSSKFDAMLGPTLMLIPTVAAMMLALFVLTEEPWWGRMIVPIVPTIVFALLVWIGVKRSWPRPLAATADLKKQLPPA